MFGCCRERGGGKRREEEGLFVREVQLASEASLGLWSTLSTSRIFRITADGSELMLKLPDNFCSSRVLAQKVYQERKETERKEKIMSQRLQPTWRESWNLPPPPPRFFSPAVRIKIHPCNVQLAEGSTFASLCSSSLLLTGITIFCRSNLSQSSRWRHIHEFIFFASLFHHQPSSSRQDVAHLALCLRPLEEMGLNQKGRQRLGEGFGAFCDITRDLSS